jgi:hypothetical protein
MLTDLLRKPLNVGHALVLLVVGVVVGGGAFAVAAIPGPDGKIKACLKKSGSAKGAVRIIDHNKNCSASERTLRWNQKGAAGQNGQPGAQGIQGVPGPATGAASGDLTGNYPGPSIAPGAVTDDKVAAANKDGAANVFSMRTLGTGALQAAAGNDSRLSNARTPTGAAGGDLAGTYPNPELGLPLTLGGTFASPFLTFSGENTSLNAPLMSVVEPGANASGPVIYGETQSLSADTETTGVFGKASGAAGIGVAGRASSASGAGTGVSARAAGSGEAVSALSVGGDGILGLTQAPNHASILGRAQSLTGLADITAVKGEALCDTNCIGVAAMADDVATVSQTALKVIEGNIVLHSNIRGIDQTLGTGATTLAVTFATAAKQPTASFGVQCTPSYNTTCFVTAKTVSGFTLNFGTVAPAMAKVDWLLVR